MDLFVHDDESFDMFGLSFLQGFCVCAWLFCRRFKGNN